ncbi:TPA: hypothetical protein G8L55_002781 [Salmonella enterica]|uniref:Uncharacterized protein n=1 Tax=Salmonella enterica TaxID=28901 RepID=A0A742PFB6_SALER|nr:hypothetical protein [Salmonella enterica]EBV3280240.1 hypothetical protein [Salmonella enterica subsp. enterica serovar Wangata]ECD0278060.1 hypothetical protein [Salmonella enterica subsp. enterica serovar Newport]HAU6790296.1 hypothetical protein [Salmonella enterica subsp. enterica serovar Taiping]EKN5505285.1 hypothetical protein [Salmonella enterica]
MTINRITDESLNQLIAIESLANDNAHEERRIVDQIYHAGIVAALEELRERREVSVKAGPVINNKMLVPANGPKIPPIANKAFTIAVDLAIAEFIPEEMTGRIAVTRYGIKLRDYNQWVKGWNACRAAIKKGGKA